MGLGGRGLRGDRRSREAADKGSNGKKEKNDAYKWVVMVFVRRSCVRMLAECDLEMHFVFHLLFEQRFGKKFTSWSCAIDETPL